MEVLFISVHPDDETLGCGGTILKHRAQGDNIYWLILTEAYANLGYSKKFLEERRQLMYIISERYGFKKIFNMGFPTTRLHAIDISELISKISSVINEIKPQIIYTINRSDIHTDHQVAARAIASCTKSFRYPFIKRVLAYECLSETEMAPPLPENIFIPNVYSDITDFMEQKLEITMLYESEIKEPPFPRSIENIKALARYRGSSVGVNFAEAFMLIRDIF